MRNKILSLVDDLVADFVYNDRKIPGNISVEQINTAIKSNLVTIEEITERFRDGLKEVYTPVIVDEVEKSCFCMEPRIDRSKPDYYCKNCGKKIKA